MWSEIRRGVVSPASGQLLPLVLVVLVQWLVAGAAYTVAAGSDLQVDVEYAVRSSGLGEADVAVCVRDSHSGAELVDINADKPMIVASNMKVFTSGAALHVLGPDFEFQTCMKWDGNRLTIVGSGDPAFGDPDLLKETAYGDKQGLNAEEFLQIWVDAVIAMGIEEVNELVVDDRIFDDQFVHPDWPIDQLNRYYCAEISGLNFHRNLLHVYFRADGGKRPEITHLDPPMQWLTIYNKATANDSRTNRNTTWIARPQHSNRLTVFGNVKSRDMVPIAMHDMPELFAQLFAQQLQKKGVKVRTFRSARPEDEAAEGEIVGPIISSPLLTVMKICNTNSETIYAEAMLKRTVHELTGRAGSWHEGSTLLRHIVLDRLRDPAAVDGLRCADGSGLSRDNRITPAAMTAWLDSFANDPELREPFFSSLAVPGETGTLRTRFRRTELHGASVLAKTGYINRVSCLSGYVVMPDGHTRSFSVLVNGLTQPGSVAKAKRLQERIASLVAEDLASQAFIQLGSDEE